MFDKKSYQKEYYKKYKLKNNEKLLLSGNKWRENNQEYIIKYRKEHREEHRRKHREWYRNNKDYYLLKKYGITYEEFSRILISQNGICAICSYNLIKRDEMFLDHCHNSNKVRGILCFTCNTGLGQFSDSKELLNKAIAYLDKWQ